MSYLLDFWEEREKYKHIRIYYFSGEGKDIQIKDIDLCAKHPKPGRDVIDEGFFYNENIFIPLSAITKVKLENH